MALTVQCGMYATYQNNFEPSPYHFTAPAAVVQLTQSACHYLRCIINPLTPNDTHSGRTSPLTSKRCILYIYSTNVGTECFIHGIYSPFLSSKCSLFHNSNVFGSCIIHILYTG